MHPARKSLLSVTPPQSMREIEQQVAALGVVNSTIKDPSTLLTKARELAVTAAQCAAPTPTAPGEQSVTANITVIFQIK